MFWFNRMVEYWGIPTHLDLVEHVRRARLQLVQLGDFGPMFYGLADDPQVDRSWVGMPLVGVRQNLAYVSHLFPRLREAGTRIVGQLSLSWHYGDHETGKGLWGSWGELWTGQLLGPPPCPSPSTAQELGAGGALRCWPIEGRPYRAYSGCFCNPRWRAVLKAMISKALSLGVDGFMAHHNFSSFCGCSHCREHLLPLLGEKFADADLQALLGHADLSQVGDLLAPRPDCPAPLRRRYDLEVQRAAQRRRKAFFDELFIDHARARRPDLLLSQWYHKYDFGPHDERSLLPTELWARDEDYIWYSQGGHKGRSALQQGYLADMGLPSRFTRAAAGGRPFVINKYDHRRLRLSIAEAASHNGASLAFHLPAFDDLTFAREDYYAPVIRYHRFLAEREALFHPARPHAPLALVYPRRAELEAEADSLDALKRLGRLLEDDHQLFEIITDEQIIEQGAAYETLILPQVRRLSRAEGEWLRAFVEGGGKLIFTGETGTLLPDGQPYPDCPLRAWEQGAPRVLYLQSGPWKAEEREIAPGVRVPVYPLLAQDPFGREFLEQLSALLGLPWLQTDAPWWVRVRAWRPQRGETLALHWVNYHQDEEAAIETPCPTGPLQVECAVPSGCAVEKVEWLYPEMREPTVLPHTVGGGRVQFAIPRLIVYGLSVLYLAKP